jgi:Protein of unknown function (DUF2934)
MQKDHDRIRDRAYEIWDRDGRQSGRDEEYWLQAERELGVAAGSADHTPLGLSDQTAAPGAAEPLAAPAPANKKSNGAAKGLAAKASAPRKRRGSQPISQA